MVDLQGDLHPLLVAWSAETDPPIRWVSTGTAPAEGPIRCSIAQADGTLTVTGPFDQAPPPPPATEARPVTTVRVVAPHFVACLEIGEDGRCCHAAAILRKACMGRTADELRALFAQRRWKATIVKPGAVAR